MTPTPFALTNFNFLQKQPAWNKTTYFRQNHFQGLDVFLLNGFDFVKPVCARFVQGYLSSSIAGRQCR